MAKQRFIFFDVGNTLLFPNRPRMLAPLSADRHPTLERWQELERRTKHEFDEGMMEGKVDHNFWWTFHTYLAGRHRWLGRARARRTRGEHAAIQRTGTRFCPARAMRWNESEQEYSIAVISNADGKIDAVLSRCGIADCFATITDSGTAGCEKPHPAIFEAALRAMKADPAESLYVGDVYSVDYVGARNVGMQAVLFDLAGAYLDRGVPRVDSLAALEAWLRQE